MSLLRRRFANAIARALRAARRRYLPGMDTRHSRVARAYLRWAASAARLDFVDGVVGHKMYLDDRDSLRLSVARLIEPKVTSFFQREVKPGSRVLDLGANIGYFTLLFARQAGPTGRVVAFEPDPSNFSLLQRNVALNGYAERVTAVNKAAWDSTGPLSLYLSENNRGDHRTYESNDGRRSVTIDAVRLDDFFAEDEAVDVVKMDIQGAEYRALTGMSALLARSKRVTLVTEFWPAGLARAGASGRAYLDLLTSLGFSLFDLSGEAGDVPRIDADELLSRCTPENDGAADLLCVRD